MSFADFKKLATGTGIIKVGEVEQEVNKLTIKEKQQYEKIVNQGIGTMKANVGRGDGTANLNLENVTTAQHKADEYLIKTTFKEENITADDINGLYDVYDELITELKRINHINDEDNSKLEDDIKNI